MTMTIPSLIYSLFTIIGIMAAFAVSQALNMPKPNKKKRLDIYIAAAIGLIIGAKAPVWASYGFSPELLLSGKSFMGGVLGSFVGINIYKFFTHQQDEALGGRFTIPLAVAAGFGKIGCYMYGCCGGHFFIPVQLLESAFQFAMAGGLYLFYIRTGRIDLLFPIYILSYLSMRFFIEFVREEPQMLFNLTIYQWMALIFAPVIASILLNRRARYA